MTITYPDVSNHNGAMTLQSGTVACFAKSSEGTGYEDPYYAHFKAEAARVGAVFGAYHFLKQGNGAAQARFAYGIVGPSVPMMIDFEPEYDANGNPISLPTVADAVAFRDTYRSLGGLVRLNYHPKWYWQKLGSPSLAPLADLALVSSSYTAYSDTGPGWTAYGGVTPSVWQYTENQRYSGQSVDFNAYKGTLDQFKALLGLTQGADMQWNDTINGIGGRKGGNQVDYILTDISRLRDALFGDTTVQVPAGSPLAKLLAFLNGASGEEAAVAALAKQVAALTQPTVDAAALATALAGDTAFVEAIAAAIVTKIGADLK